MGNEGGHTHHSEPVRVIGFLRNIVVPIAGFLIMGGIILTIAGILLGVTIGPFGIVWIGLAALVSGITMLLLSSVIGIGAAHQRMLKDLAMEREAGQRKPLINLPVKAPEVIDLDEEERLRVEAFLREMGFSISWPLRSSEKELSAIPLFQLSSERLARNDFHGAASTALKAIYSNSSAPQAWLALAASHAKYGDRYAARKFLHEANTRATARGFKQDFWEPQVKDVMRLID